MGAHQRPCPRTLRKADLMNRHATRLRDDAAYLRDHTEYKRTADGMELAADEVERLQKALDTCADKYAKLLDQLGAGADM